MKLRSILARVVAAAVLMSSLAPSLGFADVMQTVETDDLTRHNVRPDGIVSTGSVSSAASPVTVSNVETYNYILIGFTGAGSGNTFVTECSGDGSTWVTVYSWVYGALSSPASAQTVSTSQMFVLPITGKTCRVRVSSYGSGTVSAFVIVKRGSIPPPLVVPVGGFVASGSPDGGSPVKVGGKVNTSVQSFSNGNRADFQQTPTGALLTEEAGRSFDTRASNGTTTMKSGAGFLHAVCVNTKGASANTITYYDNTAGSGTQIAAIDTTDRTGCWVYDLAFSTGLTVVQATGTAANVTTIWR